MTEANRGVQSRGSRGNRGRKGRTRGARRDRGARHWVWDSSVQAVTAGGERGLREWIGPTRPPRRTCGFEAEEGLGGGGEDDYTGSRREMGGVSG